MRIVQINEFCGQGSTGRLVQELNEGLVNAGHESKIYFASGDSSYQYASKIGTRFDQLAHAVLSRITGLQGYFSVRSTRKLLNFLEKDKPDIIHLHNLHGNYINLKELLGYTAEKKIPIVITLHDCWFFTGKCTHFINTGCYKWKKECGKCPQLHLDNVNPTFFDQTRRCFLDKQKWFGIQSKLGIVGVSEWITNEAKDSILKTGLIESIPNWIDINTFRMTDSSMNIDGISGKKIVLMVATAISEIKGYNEMIYLSNHLPTDYKIIIVGHNSNNLDIPANVIHIESVDEKKKMAELYTLADVCVNTTKYESFGLVSIESMACGTPVIVYNNTASAYIVPQGCGVVIDEDKGYDIIVKAVFDICAGEKTMPSYEISRTIHEMYSQEKSIKRYIEFYKKLIKDENKGVNKYVSI